MPVEVDMDVDEDVDEVVDKNVDKDVDEDVDEEVDMHSNLRWWTRMWMIQIADLAVKKYKSGINTYVVKIQKLTILISPLFI